MTIKQIAKLQAEGKVSFCPRCGHETMKPKIYTNALSRVADIYVCDACGMNEAIEAYLGQPKPVENWACMLMNMD